MKFPINDITTTPEAPPRLGQPAPEKFAARQRELYPDLAPLVSPRAPQDLFDLALQVARTQPRWKIVSSENLRIEAVAITALLRFRDDIAIEVRAELKGGSSLHMRSRSRLGRDDFGANAKRIRAFLEELKKSEVR